MVDNVLVDDFSFQVNHTTKKTPVSFFEMAVLFFLQRLGLSFIDHHNILAVTAVSFFCILPEKIRSPA